MPGEKGARLTISDWDAVTFLHRFVASAKETHIRASPEYLWCLLFVLIRHGLRGGSGPQRWIRALGEETGFDL